MVDIMTRSLVNVLHTVVHPRHLFRSNDCAAAVRTDTGNSSDHVRGLCLHGACVLEADRVSVMITALKKS